MIHHTCQIKGLEEIYKEHLPGKHFFVEVGAFDGMTYSNTWGMGWSGLLIEAHPDFAAQCKKLNPEQIVVNCACGERDGETILYEYGAVSTTKLDKWTMAWGVSENSKQIKVPLKKLDTILEENNIEAFDLLVVDVEGTETEVLEGFTLEKYKPKMVIIELHEGLGTRPDQKGNQEPWVSNYLQGYKKIHIDNINTIYIL